MCLQHDLPRTGPEVRIAFDKPDLYEPLPFVLIQQLPQHTHLKISDKISMTCRPAVSITELTIVVRVKRYASLLPFRDVRAKVLDLVCIGIRWTDLDCRRKVKDDGYLGAGHPSDLDSFAHLYNEV